MLRRRRCWYCKRVGRFGWKRRPYPAASDTCRHDKACFKRARALHRGLAWEVDA